MKSICLRREARKRTGHPSTGHGPASELEGGDGGRWAALPHPCPLTYSSGPRVIPVGRRVFPSLPVRVGSVKQAGCRASCFHLVGGGEGGTADLDESPQVKTVSLIRRESARLA